MIRALLFIFPFILFDACSQPKEDLVNPSSNKIDISLDSILFDNKEQKKIDDFRFRCYTADYTINADSTLSLLYLNDNSHIIDYNLTTGSFKKIKIHGKNPLNSSSISLSKIDDVYFLLNESSELFEYHEDSSNSKVIQLDTLASFKSNNIWITADMGFGSRLPFVGDSSVVLVVVDDKPTNSKNSYTFGKVNFLTQETKFYQFQRRKEFYKYYHHLRKEIKMETVGDTLMVNYQFSEIIDLYSLKTGEYISSKTLKSKYQQNPIPYQESSKNEFENDRYAIEADYYHGLTYNPYKKCYYRLYYHTLPRMNEIGEYTISEDKVLSVAIFDQNFNWIGEQIVDKKYFWAGIVPHPDGALSFWGARHGDNYYLSLVKHD